MDFENVTDTPETLPAIKSQDPFSKPEDSGPFPTMEMSEKSSEVANAFGANNKIMAILIVSIFSTLIIGSIIAFVVIRNISASEASPEEDPYERYAKLALPTQALTPTASPTTTVEANITGPFLQEATEEASLTPADEIEENTETWKIVFDEPLLSLGALDDQKVATITASLFGPVEMGNTVCLENTRNTHQYFTKKKTSQVYEKICQETIDSKSQRFICYPYEPLIGVQVIEKLLPAKNCSNTASEIEKGAYTIYSKVFYNCNVDTNSPKSITESDCKNSIDVNSEELIIE